MSMQSHHHPDLWGQFRFSVVGGLFARPPERGKLQEEIRKLAEVEYLHPITKEVVRFGFSTIERWYYQALRSERPVTALDRKLRSDIGKSRVMDKALLAELEVQYKRYPHWSYKLHSDNLIALVKERPELGAAPSYSTVTRRMQKRGWYKKPLAQTKGQKRAAHRLEKAEVRGYETEHVHALWHLDFHHTSLRVLDENGTWYTPLALCILDDYSRLCCHIQWYRNETAEVLLHGMMQAFHKRGLPRSLMTDNGAAMIAGETKNGLLFLGIQHDKTLPYSPYQNGKQEAFWGTLEGRLIAMLRGVEPITLDRLNYTTQAWVEVEYNRTVHEETGCSPIDRAISGSSVCRDSPGSEEMEFGFTVREQRIQRRSDGTITLKGVRFEIPARFGHMRKLYVRYRFWDLSMAWLVDERSDEIIASIRPQDKVKNASGKRRVINDQKEEPSIPTEEFPPLLRKILSDYAATGMPAAYLPTSKGGATNE